MLFDLLTDEETSSEEEDNALASARAEAEAFENDVFAYMWDTYQQARSRQQERQRRWRSFRRRYRARHKDANDDSPLADINPPKLARIVDAAVKKTLQLNIPNLDRCDIMRLDPYITTNEVGGVPHEDLVKYAAWAEVALQHDLVRGQFPTEYRKMLVDLFITGNCVALPEWGMERQWRYRREPNPMYNPALPPEHNVILGPDNTFRPVPRWIRKLTPYTEFDAPRVRHINVMNVYPSETDRNNLSECSAVCIYDTVRRQELLDENIEEGGYLYANLDQVSADMEDPTVTELDYYGERDNDDGENYSGLSRSSAKLRRVTILARFVPEEITMGRPLSPAAARIFEQKFKVDEAKGLDSGWKTWVIEIIDESVIVRCQPIPDVRDKNPIRHFGLYAVPNVTWAEGFYDRGVSEEITHNTLQRYYLELVVKLVRPMWGMTREFFAQDQAQLKDGRINFTPNGIVFMKAGKSINEAMQALTHNPAALSAAAEAMERQERTMAELTQSPNVKTGVDSGGATATETQILGQVADLIAETLAEQIEAEFLHPIMESLLLLHHQFTEEEKIVVRRDDAGLQIVEKIPPEVWIYNYAVEMTAYRRSGNQLARIMALKDYAKILLDMGVANKKAIAVEMGKALNIRDAEKMFTEPPPPAFGADFKSAMSMAARQELTPPSVMIEYFEKLFGHKLTPQQIGEFGAIHEAMARAEDERQKAATAAGQEVDPLVRPPAAGGEMNPGPKRNHHSPTEDVESRAVPDDQGTAHAMQNRTRPNMPQARLNA